MPPSSLTPKFSFEPRFFLKKRLQSLDSLLGCKQTFTGELLTKNNNLQSEIFKTFLSYQINQIN